MSSEDITLISMHKALADWLKFFTYVYAYANMSQLTQRQQA